MKRYDAIIIGARVAGAATALQLARAGAKVLMVDRAREIGETLSTHALMRPAVTLLDRWGLAKPLVEAGTPVIRKTVFQYGAELLDIDIAPDGSVGGLIAPRRSLLDPALVDAAIEAGAELCLGTRFETCRFDNSGRVSGVVLRGPDMEFQSLDCDWVIGADGRNSMVANTVNAPFLAKTPKGSMTVYGYFGGLPNRGYRWMFSEGLQSGLIPTDGGLHCVFASFLPHTYKTRFRNGIEAGLIEAIAQSDPGAAEMMKRAGLFGKGFRFGGAEGYIRRAGGNGWALVGDAGYFKDPATAHGISDALMDSHRLAAALTSGGDINGYETMRNGIAFDFLDLTARIADLNWSFDELKDLHIQLNKLMKREARELAGAFPTDMAA